MRASTTDHQPYSLVADDTTLLQLMPRRRIINRAPSRRETQLSLIKLAHLSNKHRALAPLSDHWSRAPITVLTTGIELAAESATRTRRYEAVMLDYTAWTMWMPYFRSAGINTGFLRGCSRISAQQYGAWRRRSIIISRIQAVVSWLRLRRLAAAGDGLGYDEAV